MRIWNSYSKEEASLPYRMDGRALPARQRSLIVTNGIAALLYGRVALLSEKS